MMRKILAIFAFLIVMPTISAKPVIIGFEGRVDPNLIQEAGNNFTQYTLINAISVDIPENIIKNLEKNPKIRYIEEDAEVQILGNPNSQPSQQITWGIERVNAPSYWNTSSGRGIKVAVLDTGISKRHPDLAVSGGVNLVGRKKTRNFNDDNGHGTLVAGVISAMDNDIGVVGVAPDTELYGIKVLDRFGNGYISDVIEGVEWAVQNNISIISMSSGTRSYSQAFEEACTNAYNYGTLLVAAAGNSGDGNLSTDDVLYPAKFNSVIAVGAIDETNTAPSWSASGSEIELVAPGVGIYSTWLRNGYSYASGTSMATPFVSGVATLFWSKDHSLTLNEIQGLLQNAALDLGNAGKDNIYGYGLVQAN